MRRTHAVQKHVMKCYQADTVDESATFYQCCVLFCRHTNYVRFWVMYQVPYESNWKVTHCLVTAFHKERCLVGCDVQSGKSARTFRRNVMPPTSGRASEASHLLLAGFCLGLQFDPQMDGLLGVISQKIVLFVATAVTTSNPTLYVSFFFFRHNLPTSLNRKRPVTKISGRRNSILVGLTEPISRQQSCLKWLKVKLKDTYERLKYNLKFNKELLGWSHLISEILI
jgi:hypothetical protein